MTHHRGFIPYRKSCIVFTAVVQSAVTPLVGGTTTTTTTAPGILDDNTRETFVTIGVTVGAVCMICALCTLAAVSHYFGCWTIEECCARCTLEQLCDCDHCCDCDEEEGCCACCCLFTAAAVHKGRQRKPGKHGQRPDPVSVGTHGQTVGNSSNGVAPPSGYSMSGGTPAMPGSTAAPHPNMATPSGCVLGMQGQATGAVGCQQPVGQPAFPQQGFGQFQYAQQPVGQPSYPQQYVCGPQAHGQPGHVRPLGRPFWQSPMGTE